jgi:predicted dehydrogenase
MGAARGKAIAAHPEAVLAWVCSREEARGRAFIEELGLTEGERQPGIYLALESALASASCDAVVITSPNSLHYEQAAASLAAGLDVFLEYPHAVTAAQGRELLDTAERTGGLLEIGLTHHHSPASALLRSIVRGEAPESRDLGLPVADNSVLCSGNPISRWYDRDELSGGMFVASMYHFIDEARFLFGDVTAQESHYWASRDAEGLINQDLGRILLRFGSGATSSITYARGFPKPGLGSRRTVLFTGGYVEVGDGAITIRTPLREERITPPPKNALGAEIDRFVEDCSSRSAGPSAREHAQRSLEIALRAQESAS